MKVKHENLISGKQELLRQLGIEPNIHEFRDPTYRFMHPVRIAEDVTEIWLAHLTTPIPSRTRTVVAIRSFLDTHDEDDASEVNLELEKFLALNRLAGVTYRVLDATDQIDRSEQFIQAATRVNQIFTSLILKARRRVGIQPI